MSLRLALLVLRLAIVVTAMSPALVAAQVPVPPARQRDTARAPGDTAGDTVRKRLELVKWAEPDSIMAALLNRAGYTPTRYQGDRVTFNAPRTEIELRGSAAVERDQTMLVSDTIIYSDSAKIVRALGDTVVLRDPAQEADVVAGRYIIYDLVRRTAIAGDVNTAVREQETWFVHGDRFGFVGDTVRGGSPRFYAMSGTITSCELVEPHYHFTAGEIKVVSRNIMVARPAVLYIADIPVMWLPFVFQDMRRGRRSGMLSPRLGLTDIVRSSPSYRRQIENIGYYFAFSDYADATVSLDWRSGARAREGDPGWTRYNGELQYNWLSRFLSGRLAASHSRFSDGQRNTALTWNHTQRFSERTSLNASLNYVTNTTAQRTQAFTVAQALASIYSSLSYQTRLGPASVSVGGTRRQIVGRPLVTQEFPNLSITTKPISAGNWLVWSPQLTFNNQQELNIDQGTGGPSRRYFVNAATGLLDSADLDRDRRTTSANFNTPLRIFGFDWQNSVRVSDSEHDYPETRTIIGVRDTSQRSVRVFERTYLTEVNWETGISLRPFSQGRFNLVPSIRIVNTDPQFAFLVRSEQSGGDWIRQGKRLEYGLSTSPTFFGLIPGFGPFARFRHRVEPRVSYAFTPADTAGVSDEFLRATNRTRVGYLGARRQNSITVSLSQDLEAKLRAPADSAPDAGQKIKLVSLTFSPLTYDFERARTTGRTGLTTQSFDYTIRSELLPGLDVRVAYSLFEGNVLSDSARFKPFRESINLSLSLGRDRNPFATLQRVFGAAVPPVTPPPTTGEPTGPFQSPVVAGVASTRYPVGINTTGGWQATFNFTSTRQRPPVGTNVEVIDPTAICRQLYPDDVITRQACERTQLEEAQRLQGELGTSRTTEGGRFIRTPPTSTLRGSFAFNLTPRWAVQWTTGYDFERSEFADHIVSLQRDMHDWRAIFAFTQAPNGNFSFNFFVSLKKQPDLKFDYNQRTYRPSTQ